MAKLFALAQRTTDGTTGAAAWELRAPTKQAVVKQLRLSISAATATTLGIGRPAAIGVTPTTPVAFQPLIGGAVAATAVAAFAWGTGPTIPAAFLQRVAFPATIGSNTVLDFTQKDGVGGLVIPIGGSLVVWNLASNSVLDVSAIIEEAV